MAANIAELPNDAACVERGLMSAFGGKAGINGRSSDVCF
jgi:hypothetical protein